MMMRFSASCLIVSLSAVSVVSGHEVCQGQAACAHAEKHEETKTVETDIRMSLLQSRLSLQPEPGLPPLKVLAKSYYSSNPEESVRWIRDYMNGKTYDSTAQIKPFGSVAAGASLENWNTIFMKGATSSPDLDEYLQQIGHTWSQAMDSQSWSAWGDFHDGTWGGGFFNLTRMYLDGISDWFYDPLSVGGLARFYLPGTTWTFEFYDSLAGNYKVGLNLACEDGRLQHITCNISSPWHDDDGNTACDGPVRDYLESKTWPIYQEERDSANFDTDPHTKSYWWKVAYAAANASLAKDFAIDVLGAKERSCPYGYPPLQEKGWSGAFWVYAISQEYGGMEMHFVESGNRTELEMIQRFHAFNARKAQGLSQGCWHQLLYNNLIVEVETLDPFVEKLKAWNCPYLAVRNGHEDYALLFAFPGNEAIVVQIRSRTLSSEARSIDEVTETC